MATLLLFAWVASAFAHEDHTHGDAPPPPDVQTAPRATPASPLFELVAVAAAGDLTIFLDRFETNAPVIDATIEVETPDGPFTARQTRTCTASTRRGLQGPATMSCCSP